MMISRFLALFLLAAVTGTTAIGQTRIGLLKYGGGGDWYANPTSLPNLIRFISEKTSLQVFPRAETVEATSPALFQFHFLHTTGHGNLVFSEAERSNLRAYLLNGGFLHIDDNYGLFPYAKKEIQSLFPDRELKKLPASFPAFSVWFPFPGGLPKIHEHHGKSPEAWGVFNGERLILLLTTETDLGDGWEDPEVHQDTPEARLQALKMGANLVIWAVTQ